MPVDLMNGRTIEISRYVLSSEFDPDVRVYTSSFGFEGELTAGQALKIETAPGGEEIAAGTVPEGKVCAYQISVSIIERDA